MHTRRVVKINVFLPFARIGSAVSSNAVGQMRSTFAQIPVASRK